MFYIDFVGRIAQKKRIEKYINDILYSFLPRIRRLVHVEITIVNECDEELYGVCWGDKQSIEITLVRKGLTLDEMMHNLAHELVHAKQYLKGELSPYKHMWKGKDYSECSYLTLPWEQEAYEKEEDLYRLYWLGSSDLKLVNL